MPVILVDRLPLPSLKTYTVISVALLSCSVYYAVQVTSEANWKTNATTPHETVAQASSGKIQDHAFTRVQQAIEPGTIQAELPPLLKAKPTLSVQIAEVVTYMVQEPLCIWTLMNMAYCCLILLGKLIQRVVFGQLRVSEQQHVKDKFWNFVFYKFIFVFGVINVQYLDEVVLWVAWFSVLGFLHLLAQLCKDRFEYLSFSPTTPGWSHARLVGLLFAILLLSGFMFLICIAVGFFDGFNTFAFMAAECVLLTVRTLHVILRYILHLYDMRGSDSGSSGNHEGLARVVAWEKRGPVAYYAELVLELAALLVDLLHHLHMLLWSNIFLSMASLVICMQLRFLTHEIQRRFKKHRNYLWVLNHLEQNYPMASAEELAQNSDNCAICWEKMETARKLPCSHLFHNSCLQSWLEQDTSCPTCRLALSMQSPITRDHGPLDHTLLAVDGGADGVQVARRPPANHFFHFDGSRYVSWLPSFSVEVTHTQLLRADQGPPVQTSQLDAMARQVQQLFPHMPMPVIMDDLRLTRSVEITIENILDGRLVAPPGRRFHEEPSGPIAISSVPTVLPQSAQPSAPDASAQSITHSDSTATDEEPSNLGGRFSKSPSERERILHLRKEQLLQAARRRYLDKQEGSKPSLDSYVVDENVIAPDTMA